jgi:hypothetical protein
LTRAAQVRQWLADHPGWHFMGDICEGMGALGSARIVIAAHVGQMARRRLIQMVGKQGSKRYAYGRDARKYTTQKQGEPHAS